MCVGTKKKMKQYESLWYGIAEKMFIYTFKKLVMYLFTTF